MHLILDLLICTTLALGSQQRVYLVKSQSPVVVQLHNASGRQYDAPDGTGGTRSTLVVTLECGARVTISDSDSQVVIGRWCAYVPGVAR
jgi:hypothetical protein